MKVLVVEDDPQLTAFIKTQLEAAGLAVDVAMDGEDGYFKAAEISYDAIVLDLNLPQMDGIEVCQKLRAKQVLTPVLMVTARGGVADRVQGLEVGADDYVPKPVDGRELVARVRALIRRSGKQPTPVLDLAGLKLEPSTQRVWRDNREIKLNPKEFAVLEYMLYHSHEVVTRTMILEHVWGSDFETLSNVVDVYIRYLRKKIDLPGKQPLIHTIRGGGYSLSDQRS